MKAPIATLLGTFVVLIGFPATGQASSGPIERVPNNTLQMPAAPPVYGYAISNAFPGLTFDRPIGMATPPGETNRLFIIERPGRVIAITNLAAPTRTVFLDITARGIPTGSENGLLGIAFHPGYATNRYFFLFYSLNTTTTGTGGGNGLHQRISRFQASASDPAHASPDTELPLITQFHRAANHNGGDLHFGPDGYLYIALGDEGGGNDQYNNSQIIDRNFFAAIARIDVDNRSENLLPNPHAAVNPSSYRVPLDNPYVGATSFNGQAVNPGQVRTEFWAVGLRNPWRMSFDPVTDWLYCADVGQSAREEINIIIKGGNYGWAFREGTINGPKVAQTPPGFTHINPILEYSRGTGAMQGNSITGGLVYRGNRIPGLYGHYIFADYVSGNVWALHSDGSTARDWRRLTGETGIVSFGADPRNGDILWANMAAGAIKRLVFVPISGAPYPPTLADTGAFSDLETLTPNPGIIPYEINVPFWSDGAIKTRWFSIPNINSRITFRASTNYTFPVGGVWIKHFDMEMTNGVAESRRRLETRFIVRHSGSSSIYGVTYRWDPALGAAVLVPEEGMDEELHIVENGVIRTQVWRYPSQSECTICHTRSTLGGLMLGFNTPQLHRDVNYGGVTMNQIEALSRAGYFNSNVTQISTMRALAHPTNEAYSVEYRARSWLNANCVHCHQRFGAPGNFDTRMVFPLSEANIVHGALLNDWGDPENRAIKPGSLEHSMILTRVATLGPGRMPPVASNVPDQEGIAILREWILHGLANYQTFEQWQIANFGSSTDPEAGANADPDEDGASNRLEFLTGTDPNNPGDAWKVTSIRRDGDLAEIVFPRIANRGFEVQFATNLAPPIAWSILDRPDNRPFFAATNGTALVSDVITNETRYYRVRVYEP
jgi:glucose/arabinose dehydrogenase